MLEKSKLDRINELAGKSKSEGLTEAEKKEQALLRQEYLENFRKNFKSQLDRIKFVDEVSGQQSEPVQRDKNRQN